MTERAEWPICHKVPLTEQSATIALRDCRKGHKHRRERGMYKCPRCGWFHLTSQKQRKPTT